MMGLPTHLSTDDPEPPETTIRDVRRHLARYTVNDGLEILNRFSRAVYLSR
jgi:hypothetical protein